jgi:hypothetical protein
MNLHNNGLILGRVQAGFGKLLAAFRLWRDARLDAKINPRKGRRFDGNVGS